MAMNSKHPILSLLAYALLATGRVAPGSGGPAAQTPERCSPEQRCPVGPVATLPSSFGPSLLQLEQRRSVVPGSLPASGFEPVRGGVGQACRGADAEDSSPQYYALFPAEPDLEACKARCWGMHGCRGVEFGPGGRCEVWTRPAGIGTSKSRPGFTCLRLSSSARFEFEPVDGGTNRVCRGAATNDNSNTYWKLHMGIASLAACKEECVRTSGCKGVEYRSSGGRCEVWVRPLGIGTTKVKAGYTCWRYSSRTTSTTPVPMTTMAASPVAPATQEGCECLREWVMTRHQDVPCLNYCCNPDGAVGGLWCFVRNASCQGQNWGYCDGAPPAVPTVTARPTWLPSDPDALQVLPVEWEHFQLLNDWRARGHQCPGGEGYPPNSEPLRFDCRLWRAARGHSQAMADWNHFGETAAGTGQPTPWERLAAEGTNADLLHIAAACDTAECALNKWKESDEHCNNLFRPDFKMVAVGVGYNTSSTWEFYWTQFFKTDEVDADTSCYPQSGPLVGDTASS